MTTAEPELSEPVDLCTSDGRRLNPHARGWSRQPLHRANLAGQWSRTKRWDYWLVLTEDLFVAVTYADVDYLGLATVDWGELSSGRRGGRMAAVPLARGFHLPEVPGTEPLRYCNRRLELALIDEPGGTRLTARWSEPDGGSGDLDLLVEAPPGHESLNVVIPWSEKRFQFTSKHQARPVTGSVTAAGHEQLVGGDAGAAWGVLDVGRGRWPYRTRWNWGGGAGRAMSGEMIGVQVGGKWTAGTGFTENGIIVDGRLVKVGDELVWQYRWDDPMAPWRVRSPDGELDLTLAPRFDRHARTNAVVLATEAHQVFGHWSGTVPSPEGTTLQVEGLLGFAEESRSRW